MFLSCESNSGVLCTLLLFGILSSWHLCVTWVWMWNEPRSVHSVQSAPSWEASVSTSFLRHISGKWMICCRRWLSFRWNLIIFCGFFTAASWPGLNLLVTWADEVGQNVQQPEHRYPPCYFHITGMDLLLRRRKWEYRIVLNKRSLCVDKHPGGFRAPRGTFTDIFSHFCLFVTNFGLFWGEYFTRKRWGRVYSSRYVYSALYDSLIPYNLFTLRKPHSAREVFIEWIDYKVI